MMRRYFRFLNELHKSREEGSIRTPEEVKENFKEGNLDSKSLGYGTLAICLVVFLLIGWGVGSGLMGVKVPEKKEVVDETEYNVISYDLPRGGSCTHRKDVSSGSGNRSSESGMSFNPATSNKSAELKVEQKKELKRKSTGGCSSHRRTLKQGVFAKMTAPVTAETVENSDAFQKSSSASGINAMLAGQKGLKRGGKRKAGGGIGFGAGTGSGFGGGSGGSIANLSGSQTTARTIKRVRIPKACRSASSSEIKMEKKSLRRSRSIKEVAHNTEETSYIKENSFMDPLTDPLSTVSIDVDNASYTNLRRILNSGGYPVKNSVRLEETINYFKYDYKEPTGLVPFSVYSEVGQSPWNKDAKLLHIGLKGREIFPSDVPKSNLVFLLDVSGSMSSYNKLPLLKESLPLLVRNLKREDRVSIVVYAGAAGVVLPSTSGADKNTILNAIDELDAGGSTAGGAGIQLAYKIAEENFITDGNNRIILATDGDFNVGVSSTNALVELMKEKREKGIALTVLGFGNGNYKDSRMEQIADKGNGNYYYIDSHKEAKKVLMTDMVSTLHTIAKDVKLQIEFNPQQVKKYRLVGYVNRVLATQDFDDDTKDAGELGAGHTVTALYEIIPQSVGAPKGQPLKYQKMSLTGVYNELGTIKLRWKKPRGDKSTKVEYTIKDREKSFAQCSENYRFSAAVAEFILKVNGSKQTKSSWEEIKARANAALGSDEFGYRKELLSLIDKAKANEGSGGSYQTAYNNSRQKVIRRRPNTNSGAINGGRSRAMIMRTVRGNMASLKYYYNKHLKTNPSLKTKIKVKWAIDEFGNVMYCRVISSSMKDDVFEKEVLKRIRSWAFGKINVPGDVTEVTYPFIFTQ